MDDLRFPDRIGKRWVLALTFVIMLLAWASPPPAISQEETPEAGLSEAQVLDMIVATVDDEVVLLSELLADLQIYIQQIGTMPGPAERQELLEEALESRIQEKMLVAKARRDEIQIGEEELEQALDQHVARLKEQAGGEQRFQRELDREGLTLRDLRKKLSEPMREQLLVQRILERVSFGIDVSGDDVRRFYEENRDKPDIIPMRPRAVLLAHILVQPKPDAAQQASLTERLDLVSRRLDAGEDFGDVAKELSEGPAASRGGDLGWFRIGDIALPELQLALSDLPVGEIRRDVVSERGHHILKMEERDGTRVRFRQILIAHPTSALDEDRARKTAREAWQALNQGEDWDAVVARYSDDEVTRDEGGKLPLIPEEQMDDRYRSVIGALEPGEYSGVFLGERGFQIVKLIERESSRPFLFEEIEEQIRNELLMRKRNEALDDYVATLEGELLVQRKGLPDLEKIAGLGGRP